jgi:hypothetical protein
MSSLKQREKLLQQVKTETEALRVLRRAKAILQRTRWFNQSQYKGDICAQMAISEAGTIIKKAGDRKYAVGKATNLLLDEAQTLTPPQYHKQWISIPHWNDAQKNKKDVLKVFRKTIVDLQKKLQPV